MRKTSLLFIFDIIVLVLILSSSSFIDNPIINILFIIGLCVFLTIGSIKTNKERKLDNKEENRETKTVNYILLYISIAIGLIGGVICLYFIFSSNV